MVLKTVKQRSSLPATTESRLSSSGKSQQKEKKIKTAPKIKIKAEIKTDRQEAREKSYTRSSSENN